jgi:hypothetical protein
MFVVRHPDGRFYSLGGWVERLADARMMTLVKARMCVGLLDEMCFLQPV